jgi:hypothetical protein
LKNLERSVWLKVVNDRKLTISFERKMGAGPWEFLILKCKSYKSVGFRSNGNFFCFVLFFGRTEV